MTATLLALLIQSPFVTWSTTLSDALPGFNISSRNRNTTIEMLTSHRSGLTDMYVSDCLFAVGLQIKFSYEGRWLLANRSLAEKPTNKKGTYTYANTNFVITGLLIHVYFNSTAEEYFQTRLWGSLNMSTAGWAPVPESIDTSIDNP
jgi:CubicO group peptidase (beta-lactamase class C family)